MRLIGSLKTQQEAFIFQKFLKSKGIDLLMDQGHDTGVKIIRLWVVNEDDTEKAEQFFAAYQENPAKSEFYVVPPIEPPEVEYDTSAPQVVQKNPRLPLLTWVWIMLSALLFFVQLAQEETLFKTKGAIAKQVNLSPVEQALFFDVPKGFSAIGEFLEERGIKDQEDMKRLAPQELLEFEKLKETSYFHGFLEMAEDPAYRDNYSSESMPLFEKIRQGQLYRLLSPVFMHGGLLHVLFNMILFFILMKQIEMKLGLLKAFGIAAVCGIVPNIFQYLISGPFFVGASGVVMGLAAFIWIRQKKAPWEGYTLPHMLFFFLMLYVFALVALSIGVFVFNLSTHRNIAFGIANTAHVVGGLTGLVLGSIKIFRRT